MLQGKGRATLFPYQALNVGVSCKIAGRNEATGNLVHKTVALKPSLTDGQKSERRDAAATLLRRSANKLKWTVWADEASVQVVPDKRRKIYTSKTTPAMPVSDAHKRNWRPMTLKWMGAVMYGKGAVSFELLTGSTGFESAGQVSPKRFNGLHTETPCPCPCPCPTTLKTLHNSLRSYRPHSLHQETFLSSS